MQNRNRTFRRRVGIVGWFALFLAALIAAGLALLWCCLADYQRSLPQNLAAQILTAYQSGDAKTIAQYSVNLPEPLENPALFARYYTENTKLDDLYFYPGAAENADELTYEFAAGNDSIATLTLRKTREESRFGFPVHEIKSLMGHPLTDYTITAPADTALFVNGGLLSDRYRTDAQTVVENFVPLTNAAYRTKAYEITDFSYIDELGGVSADGCEAAVTWSEDGRAATVEKRISAEEREKITVFANTFSEAYSVFATKQNGARAPVLKLLYKETPFHKALLLYKNDWGEAYVSDRYENRVIDRMTRYSPTEFSCDIRFDYVITFRDGFEKTYPYAMTYYLTNRTGELLLVDMQN